jgi:hypothetical protein
MKIEIEIPELDESEWEYVGVEPPAKGEMYYDTNGINEWTYERSSDLAYPCFRRRADPHAWKQNIKWPSVFREGTWVARDEDGSIHLFYAETPLREMSGFDNGGDYIVLDQDVLDLSFLPPEFFSCDWKYSLVQVRHGGEG